MVRTRATRIKPDSQNASANKESQDSAYSSPTMEEKPKRLFMFDLKKQIQKKLRGIDDNHRNLIDDLNRQYEMIKMKIGPHYGEMLLSDFLEEEITPPERYDSFAKPKNASKLPRNFVTSTVRKERDSSPSPKATRVTRQSRQRSMLARSISEDNISMIAAEKTTITETKTTRRTRSVSNKRQTMVKSIYGTPASKTRNLTAVTPKADPATTALKRHPRHGEFALSLTGSPLMIPGGCSETNITLPLSNGEVYSILPTDDFVAGQIPALSEDTRKQILLLRKNLDRLLLK